MNTKPPILGLRARPISRRSFLAATGAVTTFIALPAHVLGRADETSPNNKLNIAGIGVGGQGGSDVDQLSSENIVALCDVDEAHAAHTYKKYPNAKRYKDFRQMLDQDKSIDAVDRKSTRLNSSHLGISYAVFCL